jgi:hypothetical protein
MIRVLSNCCTLALAWLLRYPARTVAASMIRPFWRGEWSGLWTLQLAFYRRFSRAIAAHLMLRRADSRVLWNDVARCTAWKPLPR